jgi:hypothetical protein
LLAVECKPCVRPVLRGTMTIAISFCANARVSFRVIATQVMGLLYFIRVMARQPIYLKLLIDGMPSWPFSARTLQSTEQLV